MLQKISFDYQKEEKFLEKYFDRLYPICRSILGKGFRESLDILGEIVDLNIKKVKTGKKVLDWTIPDEWNVLDAYIVSPKGKKIAQFKKHNLHVVGYSIPVNKVISLNELKKNLHTLPEQPNAIPYVTSYYKRTWGFCLKYDEYKKLKKGNYRVYINSTLKPGNLVYSDKLIKGKSKKEILLSTYLCHPQMANHELSGPLAWSMLYKFIKATGPHKYSYRFLICPENIGSAAFLHNSKRNIKNIIAGFIINCVGNGKKFTYKKSRRGNSLADRAALNVLKHLPNKLEIIDFFPDGSDERQFCSPGFNLPIGLIMRNMYGRQDGSKMDFKEYHTSLDNKKMISFKTIIETVEVYIQVLNTIENNFKPLGKVLYGTPQLSKSPIKLYGELMNFRIKNKQEKTRIILQILNLAEGKLDLLQIAKLKNFKIMDHYQTIQDLLKSKYIKAK
jgi:aminopeptidase-like protein